jgi:hypothetical protein
MIKSFEYSKMCAADVCLGIRIRDTGRVYIFSADASGVRAFVGSKLVYSHHMHIRPRANSFRTAIIHPQVKLLTRTSVARETTRCLWLSRGPNLRALTGVYRWECENGASLRSPWSSHDFQWPLSSTTD